jgi:8-oxo-dGTP diphosphatase
VLDTERFPELSGTTQFDWGAISFEDEVPSDDLISNVTVVPFIGDKCVLIFTKEWGWMIPGGTLEPAETYQQAARRELIEEAGAQLLDFNLIFAIRHESRLITPYRQHLPFPVFYRLVGYGGALIVGEPTNPVGGEEVLRVELLDVEEAVKTVGNASHGWYAAAIRIASESRRKDN